jgi:serine/threonine protein kinase
MTVGQLQPTAHRPLLSAAGMVVSPVGIHVHHGPMAAAANTDGGGVARGSTGPCATIGNPIERESCERAMRIHGGGGATPAISPMVTPAVVAPAFSPQHLPHPFPQQPHQRHASPGFVQSNCKPNSGAMNLAVCDGTWHGRPAIVKFVKRSNGAASVEKEISMLHAVLEVCGLEANGRQGCKHVVTIYDAINGMNGSVGIVMKLLNGGNLAEQITHPTHSARRWTYIAQVYTGLQFLHRNGIIHCDIKPDNIMLHSESGKPEDTYAVITDLGLAVRKGEPIIGAAVGFHLYLPPHPALESQDLFALLLTVYCLYEPGINQYANQVHLRAKMDEYIRARYPDVTTGERMLPGFQMLLAAY